MKKVSLEYCKFILEKVSFDEALFEKELNKAFKMLMDVEIKELVDWVRTRFRNHKVTARLQHIISRSYS